MFRHLPLSVRFFIFTALVYLLQLIPLTGIALMLFAAPYWSILTVNAGFAAMVFDCRNGRMPHWLLLAPALWFGGYYVAAVASHIQAGQVAKQADAFNAAHRAAFDPNRQDLLIEEKAERIVSPQTTIQDYALPSIFVERTASSCGSIQSLAIRTDLCSRGFGVVGETAPGCKVIAMAISDGVGRDARTVPGVCIVSEMKRPTRPVVRVGLGSDRDLPVGLLAGRLSTVLISQEGKDPIPVQTGWIRPLAWFPMPILGCALNSGNPSWDCVAGFQRASKVSIGSDGVANVLGLKRESVERRYPVVSN